MLMPFDSPSQVGRTKITAAYRAYFKVYKCDLTTENQELEIAGDWAFLRGAFTTVVTPKAGGPLQGTHGKFLIIVRRGADGVWRFSRDMFSPDSPVPPDQK
jgi:ketosteroid isomerase-like protein